MSVIVVGFGAINGATKKGFNVNFPDEALIFNLATRAIGKGRNRGKNDFSHVPSNE